MIRLRNRHEGRMSDLEQVISASISGMGDTSTGSPETPAPETPTSTETSTETPAAGASSDTPAATPPVTPPADAVSETPEAPEGQTPPEDSLETLQRELAGKRDNRIPYSRVTKIVENAVKKEKARADALEAASADYKTPEFQNSLRAMELADQEPEKFLTALAKADSRYADLLQRGISASGAAPAKPAGAAAASTGEIAPNIQLTDGTLGYDATAVNQLLERQAQKLQDAFEIRLNDFKPIKDEHETRVLRSQAEQRVRARIDKASKWPGFTEHAADIHAAMTADKTLDLHEAYLKVVIPKFQADETAVRQRIVAEMNSKAKATAGIAPAAAAPAAPAPVPSDVDPTIAAIQASIAGLKR